MNVVKDAGETTLSVEGFGVGLIPAERRRRAPNAVVTGTGLLYTRRKQALAGLLEGFSPRADNAQN